MKFVIFENYLFQNNLSYVIILWQRILFISSDTCSDSIAKLFCACFYGVSHNYRAICCKMGYRTDVPV